MIHRLLLGALAGILVVGAAAAQSRITIEPATGTIRQADAVRVQSSISFFVSGPTGDSEEAVKVRERARRIVYEMAAHECDLLREVLAKECRLESVNTNLNRQFGQGLDGYTMNGSMSFQITLK
jgi:hypothetical protein